jgi:hypothetical protein
MTFVSSGCGDSQRPHGHFCGGLRFDHVCGPDSRREHVGDRVLGQRASGERKRRAESNRDEQRVGSVDRVWRAVERHQCGRLSDRRPVPAAGPADRNLPGRCSLRPAGSGLQLSDSEPADERRDPVGSSGALGHGWIAPERPPGTRRSDRPAGPGRSHGHGGSRRIGWFSRSDGSAGSGRICWSDGRDRGNRCPGHGRRHRGGRSNRTDRRNRFAGSRRQNRAVRTGRADHLPDRDDDAGGDQRRALRDRDRRPCDAAGPD